MKPFKEYLEERIVKLPNGKYRLLSHSGKNLGTFDSRKAAAKHEGEVKWFKKHQKNEEVIVEVSPPDPEIEKWIKDNKERFKKEYGDKKGLEVLYAKAWSMYNKESVEVTEESELVKTVKVPAKEFEKDKDQSTLNALKYVIGTQKVVLTKLKVLGKTTSGDIKNDKSYYTVQVSYKRK